MVGEDRPSTSFLGVINKIVDGGPSPAMTGKAEQKSKPFRPLDQSPSVTMRYTNSIVPSAPFQ
jgi:hypothetical protein